MKNSSKKQTFSFKIEVWICQK